MDGEEKATGEVCLGGEKNDRVAFQARADYQNHAIGWLHRAGLVFCPPAEHRELMSGLAIPFSMWQCAGHGDAAGPGFVR